MSAVTKTRTIKYLSVYQDLKEAILSGKYLRGSFLPTEVELTEIYSVSHTTVRKAVCPAPGGKAGPTSSRGAGTEVISRESQIRPTAPQIYSDVVSVSSRYLNGGDAVASIRWWTPSTPTQRWPRPWA